MMVWLRKALQRHLTGIDPRHLWKRYTLALIAIFILIGSSHIAAQWATNVSADNAVVINESGRQRMLSQRILYFAAYATQSGAEGERGEMRSAVDLFEASHNKLTSMPDLSPALRKAYFSSSDTPSLDTLVRRYVVDARAILGGADEQKAPAQERLRAMGAGILLTKLHAAVMAHEAKAMQDTAMLSKIQKASLISALLILLLEAILIFLPAHLSARAAFERLKRQRDQLQSTHSEIRERNAELETLKGAAEYDALHDALTGLANRRYLEREMNRRCLGIERDGDGVGVLHIDLDRFKEINDTLGHPAGDFILQHVAEVLRESIREGDFVARIGGDEFVALTKSDGNPRPLKAIAARMIERLGEPISYNGELCHFGASVGIDIGIACGIGREINPDRILSNADIALYRAKELGRGRFEFFSKELRAEVEHAKALGDELLLALSRSEFFPVYQAQVDAQTGEISGVEALARWRHPEKGEISPGIFLPLAERIGVTQAIDDVILRKAVRDFNAWQAAGIDVPSLSVNVSARRLTDSTLQTSLAEIDIPKGALTFEIIESVLSDQIDDQMRFTLDSIDEQGIDIEVDDFGTGHASLLGLLALRPKRVKIARELVAPIVESEDHRAILSAALEIARALKIEVIAEGVETIEQADMLRELGCQYLQGFLFCRPLTREAFIALASSNKTLWPQQRAA